MRNKKSINNREPHEIEISHEVPAIYEILNARFDASWNNGIIIAYDGRIHCKNDVEPQKLIHEKVHLDRQAGIGNDVWWTCYLEDPAFRLQEEKLAYKAEAVFLKKYIKDREIVFHMLRELASNMASDIYGRMVTKEEALTLLIK